MEAAQMPISKWVGKKVMVQTYNGVLLGHKKVNFTICHSTDGSTGYYAKWDKSVRERQTQYHMLTLACGI